MDDNITRRERAEDASGRARKSCRCRQRGCGAPPDGAVDFVNWRRLDFTGLSPKDVRRADGQFRWWFFRSAPLQDDKGKIVKWCETSVDIEERKRRIPARR